MTTLRARAESLQSLEELEFRLTPTTDKLDIIAHQQVLKSRIDLDDHLPPGRNRSLIRVARLNVLYKRQWQERLVILFNDCIIWAKPVRFKKTLKVAGVLPIRELEVEEVTDSDAGNKLLRLSAEGLTTTFSGSDDSDTEEWTKLVTDATTTLNSESNGFPAIPAMRAAAFAGGRGNADNARAAIGGGNPPPVPFRQRGSYMPSESTNTLGRPFHGFGFKLPPIEGDTSSSRQSQKLQGSNQHRPPQHQPPPPPSGGSAARNLSHSTDGAQNGAAAAAAGGNRSPFFRGPSRGGLRGPPIIARGGRGGGSGGGANVMRASDPLMSSITDELREQQQQQQRLSHNPTSSAPPNVSPRRPMGASGGGGGGGGGSFPPPRASYRPAGMHALPLDLAADIQKFHLETYAKKHFQTQRKKRKGWRKQEVSLEKLLVYTEKPIKDALLKLPSSSARKEARSLFKKILKVMGDAASNEQRGTLTHVIIEAGMHDSDLRDEIYCQLLKQTQKCPHENGLERAYHVLTLCCSAFPPSKTFEDSLIKVLEERQRTGSKMISRAAALCRSELRFLLERHIPGRVAPPNFLARHFERPLQRGLFRNTLESIMSQQRSEHAELEVPHILVFLTASVMRLSGQKVEGIFRVAANDSAVNTLRASIELGSYVDPERNPHIPACLLKQWLRELEVPLVPFKFYDQCIKTAANGSASECVALVKKFPPLYRNTLSFLIRYLKTFLSDTVLACTKMGMHNIAVVFAPTLLFKPNRDDEAIVGNAEHEATFVSALLEELE